jgi:glycosyltransferase involved in cell wall biosynthesis
VTRLRVALETQYAHGPATGLGVYARWLAAALRDRDDLELVEVADPAFDLWRFDRRIYWDQMRAPRLLREARADIVHCTGGTLPWRVPRPVVLTLHDLVWLRGANRGRPYVRWYFGDLQPRLARRADAIIADTDAARDDIAQGLGIDPARIAVCGAGLDPRFFDLKCGMPDFSPAVPYVLSVGTVEERKDLITAVRALAHIPDLRRISAGPLTPYSRLVANEAERLGISDRVQLLGFVDDAQLLSLYERAAAFIFPSRYEGFGLPPLQALAAGVPVVASRIPVLEEVLGDCALLAPPGDAHAFAQALRSALDRSPYLSERGRIRARSFTWENVADKVVSVYRGLM